MNTVPLPSGETVPALGLGTWRMGESAAARSTEVAALRFAVELGFRLIDTAEMYGEGGAEERIGEALADRRDELFLVSKVYPHNASRSGAIAACERSLRRLRSDRLDLYLLHWRGHYPLAETVDAFETLKHQGKIRHWGVSNFAVADLEELSRVTAGAACAANQVYYAATTRGIEFDLLPWQRQRKLPVMAYSPLAQGALARDKVFLTIADRHGVTAARVALAWVLTRPEVIAIPKSVKQAHLEENWAAAQLQLTTEDLAEIDARYPPPSRKTPLATT